MTSLDQPVFPIGYVPGVLPDKWFKRWRDRRHKPMITPTAVTAQGWREAIESHAIQACFVRLSWGPEDSDLGQIRQSYNAVALYEELQVAVLPKDHVLTVLDSVTTKDLQEESTPQPHADIDAADMAVELAAAGVGAVVLPMAVARLHARRDVTYRTVSNLPTTPVVLVWHKDLPKEMEQAIQTFVGIVRGRKEGSGREQAPSAAVKKPAKKLPPQRKPQKPKTGTGTGPSKSRQQKGKKAGWATATPKTGTKQRRSR